MQCPLLPWPGLPLMLWSGAAQSWRLRISKRVIFWRDSFQMKVFSVPSIPSFQFFWRNEAGGKGRKVTLGRTLKCLNRQDSKVRRQGEYQPIFPDPYCPFPGHSLYPAAYLSGQYWPLRSLLLELSIQQRASIASILSQSVKISNGLGSILFISRSAFCVERQPTGLKAE